MRIVVAKPPANGHQSTNIALRSVSLGVIVQPAMSLPFLVLLQLVAFGGVLADLLPYQGALQRVNQRHKHHSDVLAQAAVDCAAHKTRNADVVVAGMVGGSCYWYATGP